MLDEEVEEAGPEESGPEEGGEEERGEDSGEAAPVAAAGGFWGSLKGIITASTGMIVAIGGLITVLANSGVIGNGDGGEDGQDAGDDSGLEAPADMPDQPDMPTDLAEVDDPDSGLVEASDTSDPDPSDTVQAEPETRMFVVISRSDGWAAVRSRPTISSTMLSRLETGDFVRCGRTVDDAGGIPNRFWRYCPEVEGHVAASLLRRVRN
ncbi:MAG: hypothetical protein AAFQ27_02670 [Pseudomonadota bacterium]